MVGDLNKASSSLHRSLPVGTNRHRPFLSSFLYDTRPNWREFVFDEASEVWAEEMTVAVQGHARRVDRMHRARFCSTSVLLFGV